MSHRAQTESIGVILLTAVIVVTVAAAGSIVLADASGDPTTQADLSVTIADEGVAVDHDGGGAIPFDNLRVVVQHGNETWRPPVNASGLVTGNGDDSFVSGERWVWRQPLDTDEVTTVHVFDRRTETLLAESRRYPSGESSLTPTPATSAEAPSETPTPTPSEPSTATATPTPDTTAPSVTVSSASTTVQSGETTTLEWSATDTDSGVDFVDVQYSTDGGETWFALLRGADAAGSYNWRVPNTQGQVRVRVRAADRSGNDAFASTEFTVGGKGLSGLSVSDITSGSDREQDVSFTIAGELAEGETVTIDLSDAQDVQGGQVNRVDYRSATLSGDGNAEFTTQKNDDAVITFTAPRDMAGGEAVSFTISGIETAEDYSAKHTTVFERSDATEKEFEQFVVKYEDGAKISGSVEGEVYTDGDVTLSQNANVDGNVTSEGNVTLSKNANVGGSVSSESDLVLGQNSNINGNVTSNGSVTLGKNTNVGESVTSKGDVTLEQNSNINGNVTSSGNVTLGKNTNVGGSVTSGGTVTLGQNSNISGDVYTEDGDDIVCGKNASINNSPCETYKENY